MAEKTPLREAVGLPEGKVLVKILPDYYKNRADGKPDLSVRDNESYSVGIIVASRSKEEFHQEGMLIYYEKDIAPVLHVKGYGNYELVNLDHHVLLYRPDEKVEL